MGQSGTASTVTQSPDPWYKSQASGLFGQGTILPQEVPYMGQTVAPFQPGQLFAQNYLMQQLTGQSLPGYQGPPAGAFQQYQPGPPMPGQPTQPYQPYQPPTPYQPYVPPYTPPGTQPTNPYIPPGEGPGTPPKPPFRYTTNGVNELYDQSFASASADPNYDPSTDPNNLNYSGTQAPSLYSERWNTTPAGREYAAYQERARLADPYQGGPATGQYENEVLNFLRNDPYTAGGAQPQSGGTYGGLQSGGVSQVGGPPGGPQGWQIGGSAYTPPTAFGYGPGSGITEAQQAAGMARGAGGNVAGALGAYQDPYENQVVQTALTDIDRSRQLATQQNRSDATRAGAFGGDRSAILESETNRAYADQAARTAGQLRSQGFDRSTTLAQQDAERGLMGAGLLSSIGGDIYGRTLGTGQAISQIGAEQQGMYQDELNAAAARYYEGQDSPRNRLAFLSQLLQGVPQTTQSRAYTPTNRGAGVLGGALSGAGLGAKYGGTAGPWGALAGAGIGGLLGLF